MNCAPSVVVKNAACFACISKDAQDQVRLYLLCRIAANGLVRGNLIPPGSTYGPGAQFCISIQPNTYYRITWGSNEVSATVCGDTYTSTGAGTNTVFYSGSCTQVCLTGIAQGTTVTALVQVVHNVCAPPTGMALSYNPNGQVNVTWNTPPAGVANTEIWTSTDGVNYAFNQFVSAPGNSTTVNAPGAAQTLYVEARSNCTSPAVTSSFNKSQSIFGNWAQRVVNNGGAQPSQATLNALQTFYNSLVTTTVWNKLVMVNFIAPDSLIAAKTPLLVGGGNDPWIDNTASVAGCLNANGWLPNTNANNHALQTGASPSSLTLGDVGLSCYVYSAGAANGQPECLACANGTPNYCDLQVNSNGTNPAYNAFYCATVDNSFAMWKQANIQGFVSASRTSTVATGNNIYFASSVSAFALQGTSSLASSGAIPNIGLEFGGINNNGTHTVNASGGQQLSFAALHHGLSAAETQTFYNAVQAFRVALGGGFR